MPLISHISLDGQQKLHLQKS